jgi:hypothetical protein
MDRGYIDFERLFVFEFCSAFFVVRTKENVLLQRRYSHPVDKTTGVRSDHTVILTAIIELTSFGKELIQNVHVMHFAVGNADKRGDISVQIQQRMHLHRRLLPKLGPRKEREAKIDGGGVQSIQTLVQIDIDRIARIQRACDSDQDLRKVGI